MHPVASAPVAPFGRATAQPRSRARALMASILIGASVAAAALPVPALAKGPASLADLAEQVTDAVVNISASTTVEARGGRAMPQVPRAPRSRTCSRNSSTGAEAAAAAVVTARRRARSASPIPWAPASSSTPPASW